MHNDDLQRLTSMVCHYGVAYVLSSMALVCDQKSADKLDRHRKEFWDTRAKLLREWSSKVSQLPDNDYRRNGMTVSPGDMK